MIQTVACAASVSSSAPAVRAEEASLGPIKSLLNSKSEILYEALQAFSTRKLHVSDEGIDAMQSLGTTALVTVFCEPGKQFGLSFFMSVLKEVPIDVKDIIIIHGALKKVHAISLESNFSATAGNALDFSSPAGNAVLPSYVGSSPSNSSTQL